MTVSRVVLADDLSPVLSAVSRLLQDSFEIVGKSFRRIARIRSNYDARPRCGRSGYLHARHEWD